MKRGKVLAAMEDGSKKEVEAEIMSPQWAIHKDFDGKGFVLTHIPSGMRAWSSRTKTRLKLLVQEPEFFETINVLNFDHVESIVRAITRFCGENGWD